MKAGRRIRVLYAGGTIGMVKQDGSYRPGDALPAYLARLTREHPALRRHHWQVESLSPLLDSANAGPADWHGMARRLWRESAGSGDPNGAQADRPTAVRAGGHVDGPADGATYGQADEQADEQADAAIVLHGTDTMDYACAFLSFFMRGLRRPVVFTGSQQPLGVAGGDAESNLLQTLHCALHGPPEVMLCMGGRVLRASRIAKLGVDPLQGFQSPHWPDLGRFDGEDIAWLAASRRGQQEEDARAEGGAASGQAARQGRELPEARGKSARQGLAMLDAWSSTANPSVGVLRLYPGMPPDLLSWMGERHPQGLVLQTYGSGTGPTASPAFRDALARLHRQGVPMVAVSQCPWAQADLATYEAGRLLMEAGVLAGGDLTAAAAYAKLHYLAALRRLEPAWQTIEHRDLQAWMSRPLAGETGNGAASGNA